MTEIKPCPFCKSTSNIPAEHEEWCFLRKRADYSEDYFTAGFGGGEFDWKAAYEHRFDRHSNEELIEAWNTRAERTCKNLYCEGSTLGEGGFRCSLCDGEMFGDAPKYCCHCGAKVVSR